MNKSELIDKPVLLNKAYIDSLRQPLITWKTKDGSISYCSYGINNKGFEFVDGNAARLFDSFVTLYYRYHECPTQKVMKEMLDTFFKRCRVKKGKNKNLWKRLGSTDRSFVKNYGKK